jgi:ligand-binding SRPBCC domain-containing protein
LSRTNTYSYAFSLPAGVEATFELFSDPHQLNTLTPSWFALEPHPHEPRTLAPGVEIDYRLRWRGLPLHWTSRIVEWQPPHRLTYEQLRGPYRWFRHEHLFEAEAGGTHVVDRVAYRAPGGRPINRLLLRPDLERIFRHRAQAARRILGPDLPVLHGNAAAGPQSAQADTA